MNTYRVTNISSSDLANMGKRVKFRIVEYTIRDDSYVLKFFNATSLERFKDLLKYEYSSKH